jgi:hypothetical protein
MMGSKMVKRLGSCLATQWVTDLVLMMDFVKGLQMALEKGLSLEMSWASCLVRLLGQSSATLLGEMWESRLEKKKGSLMARYSAQSSQLR